MRREWRDWRPFAKHFLRLHNFPSRAVLVEYNLPGASSRVHALLPSHTDWFLLKPQRHRNLLSSPH
jgi:hypothetical protein